MTRPDVATRPVGFQENQEARRAETARYRSAHREKVNAGYRRWYDTNRARVAEQRKARRALRKLLPARGKRVLWITGALIEMMLQTGNDLNACTVLDGLPRDVVLHGARCITAGDGNILELTFDSATWPPHGTGPIPRLDVKIAQQPR